MSDTIAAAHARLARARAAATITDAACDALAQYLDEIREALGIGRSLVAAADAHSELPPDLELWPDDTLWQALIALVLLPAAIAAYSAAYRNRAGADPDAGVLAVFTANAADSLAAAQVPAELYSSARDTLTAGREQGLSVADLRTTLAARLGDEDQMWLAARIGATEGVAAANHAALDAASAWANTSGEPVFLQWWSTSDYLVRSAHWQAHRQTIALGGWFSVGGEQARYPGDPNLSAAMRCNCRCTILQLSAAEAQAWADPTSPTPGLPIEVSA